MINLQVGDVFCIRGKGAIAATIRAAEWLLSKDNEAVYGHAGIITSTDGDTLEALLTVRNDNLKRCIGQQVLIARPTHTRRMQKVISPASKEIAIKLVSNRHLGRLYPVWRLPLHFIPWVAKLGATGEWLVCSELVAYYLSLMEAIGPTYAGINPDDLADIYRCWRNFDVKFEGILE